MKLREVFEAKHKTVYKAIKNMGLQFDTYSFLKGKRAPSEKWISKVSADLGVNVRDFLDDRGLIKDV